MWSMCNAPSDLDYYGQSGFGEDEPEEEQEEPGLEAVDDGPELSDDQLELPDDWPEPLGEGPEPPERVLVEGLEEVQPELIGEQR